jgi:hypothetical protein
VTDVGDVLDVEDGHTVVEDDPADEVREQERPEVPDVGEAVDRRAAGVHPEAVAIGGLDRIEAPGQGVAELEGHGVIVRTSMETVVFSEVLARSLYVVCRISGEVP